MFIKNINTFEVLTYKFLDLKLILKAIIIFFQNKELSEYHDYQAKSISYKAREFINQRLRALNNSFVSWVEAIIIDADGRVKLGVHSVKSGLHQVRIGQDILDRLVVVQNRTFVKVCMKIKKKTI